MTNRQKWFVLFCLMLGSSLGLLIAQQQFSGGQAVTITSGTTTVTQASGANLHVNVDSAPTTAVTGTFWQGTQPTSLASLPALAAGTAKVGIVYPYTSCGTTAVTAALQALPTVATAVTGTTSCLLTLYLHNSSSSTAYTVTITDGAGTPVPFMNGSTLNALETRTYTFDHGVKMTTGLKWNASNVAIVGAVEMLQ